MFGNEFRFWIFLLGIGFWWVGGGFVVRMRVIDWLVGVEEVGIRMIEV